VDAQARADAAARLLKFRFRLGSLVPGGIEIRDSETDSVVALVYGEPSQAREHARRFAASGDACYALLRAYEFALEHGGSDGYRLRRLIRDVLDAAL
jgi:hypothetical protein